MAHLRLIEEDEAAGELAEQYAAAAARAGKVFNILKAMSFRPEVLVRFLELHREVLLEPCGLSRADRELLAVVVSRENGAGYSVGVHVAELAEAGGSEGELDPRGRALVDFAVKLTLAPSSVAKEDIDALREHGLDDSAIHDAIQ